MCAKDADAGMASRFLHNHCQSHWQSELSLLLECEEEAYHPPGDDVLSFTWMCLASQEVDFQRRQCQWSWQLSSFRDAAEVVLLRVSQYTDYTHFDIRNDIKGTGVYSKRT